jgi:APA family basic amino acid/polyamine antiporter
MTVGTVVGVGLFTCGSSQIGLVGPWIIGFTFIALLISIWPCLIYGEMGAALPEAGGTYNYAKRGLNRVFANLAGWHYIVSVVAIGAGETLAFSNYFKILLQALGLDIMWLDDRVIALVLVGFFLVINCLGIKESGKAQNAFIFFFWGCSICWFLYMIPKTHMEYFGGFSMDRMPPFKEMMYIFGLVWWCYTGFETCVSVGGETKFPQYTLPRSLKVSIFLVFAVNAIFQWFLVALVSPAHYGLLATADAPYAEGLKVAGLVGAPIILLCIAIAFGGDLSTINPGIAAPARYIYTMAEDHSLPSMFGKLHPKFKTPNNAIILVGVINFILIATNSINYIASVSLISLALCYIIGCLAYMGLRRKYPDMKRPYKAPYGVLGCYVTILAYAFMLFFADQIALATAGVLTVMCIIFYEFYTVTKKTDLPSIDEEIGMVEEPTAAVKKSLDKEYAIWKWATIAATIIALAIYFIPFFN